MIRDHKWEDALINMRQQLVDRGLDEEEIEKRMSLLYVMAEWMPEDGTEINRSDIPHVSYDEDGDQLKVITDYEYLCVGTYHDWVNHTLSLARVMDGENLGKIVAFEIDGFSRAPGRMLEWALNFVAEKGVPVPESLERRIYLMQSGIQKGDIDD